MKKLIVYSKQTGEIIAKTEVYQDVNVLFKDYPKEYRDSLDSIVVDNPPVNLRHYSEYKVVNRELVKMSKEEIEEMRIYGKILTEEERLERRLLESLVPSQEEIEQARLMIKLLPILKEVMSNE